jgi:hypothetical protein
MNKTVKNIVMVFTLLCVLFLIVFCVELILVNREAAQNDTGAAISASEPSQPDENEEGEEPANGNGEDNGNGGDSNGDNGDANGGETIVIPVPQDGTRFELPMLGEDQTLIVYADESLFRYSEGEADWLFTYLGEGTASLEIAFDFITPPGGMERLAGVFLDGYLDGGESTVLGEQEIGESELRGHAITGEQADGDLTFEAWIHSLTGSMDVGTAVVFVMKYENEGQRAALYTIIDSMEMVDDYEEYEEYEEEETQE